MVKYIYICSADHSGSTLLDLLLGSHPRAAPLGEISQLPKNIALNTPCTCGTAVRLCLVWRDVLCLMGEHLGTDLMRDPYALNLGYPKASVVIDTAHQNSAYLIRRH
jgi:hypothetical protein